MKLEEYKITFISFLCCILFVLCEYSLNWYKFGFCSILYRGCTVMAHSMMTSEMSNKAECTQTGKVNDTASTKLLASGYAPAVSKEAEMKALQSENRELQARLRGYLILRKYRLLIVYCICMCQCNHWQSCTISILSHPCLSVQCQ